MSDWKIKDHTEDRWIDVDSRKAGEDKLEDFEGELELELQAPDGRTVAANFDHDEVAPETEAVEPEIIDETEPTETAVDEPTDPNEVKSQPQTSEETGELLAEMKESIEDDPLDILPGYMITVVDGKPSLNKRGVSVLAYHYGISITDHNVVNYPSETDYTTSEVKITVENEDGRTFVGSGEAHCDEIEHTNLLRMAETRAYKRAVIFATGTGIVGYQELVSEL